MCELILKIKYEIACIVTQSLRNRKYYSLSKELDWKKTTFEKEYMRNWIEECFKVTEAHPPSQHRILTVYKLRNRMDEPVEGLFYPKEFLNDIAIRDKAFIIRKILKKKK